MYPSMMSRAGEVEIEPYYCLPVGTNGVLTAQMAAAMAAQSQAAQGNPGVGVNVGGVAWSQPTSPTPLTRGPFNTAAGASVLSPTHGTTSAAGLVGPGGGAGGGAMVGHRLTYPKKNDEGEITLKKIPAMKLISRYMLSHINKSIEYIIIFMIKKKLKRNFYSIFNGLFQVQV